MFLITGSLRRICPWEWQKLQLEEGSDRIRRRTKRSGFHPCAVALSGLKYKKQFCHGRFLECPWQKRDKPTVCCGGIVSTLIKLYLHISGNISGHQYQSVASPADTTDYSGSCLKYSTQAVTHNETQDTHAACLEISNSDLLQKIPSSSSQKIQVYETSVFIFHPFSALVLSSS